MSSLSTTGDLNNNLEKVLTELKSTCVQVETLDVVRLKAGKPDTILPILHAILLDNSRHIARLLSSKGYTLYATNDKKFIQGVFRILRNEFCYRPSLTTEQFLSKSFAERKLIFLFDVIKLCKRKCEELERNTKESKRSKWRPAEKGESSQLSHGDPPRVQIVEEANSSLSYSSSPLHGSPQAGEESSSVLSGVKDQGVAALSRSQRQQPVKAYDKGIQQRRSNSLPGPSSEHKNTPNVSVASSTGSVERERGTDRVLERSMECWVTSPPPLSVDRSKKKETLMLQRSCWTLPASPRRKLAIGTLGVAQRTSDSDNESDSEVCSASYSEIGSPSTSASGTVPIPRSSSAPTKTHAISNGNRPNSNSSNLSPTEASQDYRIPSSKIARKLMLSGPGPVTARAAASSNANEGCTKEVGVPPKFASSAKPVSKKSSAVADDVGTCKNLKRDLSGGDLANMESLIEKKLEPLRKQFVAVVSALEQLSEMPSRIDNMEVAMKSAFEAMDNRVSTLDAKLKQINTSLKAQGSISPAHPSEKEPERTKERPMLQPNEPRRQKRVVGSKPASARDKAVAGCMESGIAGVHGDEGPGHNRVLKEKNANGTTDDFITGIEKRYKKTEQFIKTFQDLT